MKETTLEQFARDPEGFVRAAQEEQLLLTQNGLPVAVIVGVEHKDAEDWRLEQSAEFWRMIEERRQRPTRPLDEAERELLVDS